MVLSYPDDPVPNDTNTWNDQAISQALWIEFNDIRQRLVQRRNKSDSDQELTKFALKLLKKRKWKNLMRKWLALPAVLGQLRSTVTQEHAELFLHVFWQLDHGQIREAEILIQQELQALQPRHGIKRPAPQQELGCWKRLKKEHTSAAAFPLSLAEFSPTSSTSSSPGPSTILRIRIPPLAERVPVPIPIPKARPPKNRTTKPKTKPQKPRVPKQEPDMQPLAQLFIPEETKCLDVSMVLLPPGNSLPVPGQQFTPPPTPPSHCVPIERLWKPRANLPNKRPLPALPPIWAQSRQEVCESTTWFRSYQAGVYHCGGLALGYLLGGFPSFRDTFLHNGKLIISHGGGKSESLRSNKGKMFRQVDDDQLAQDKSVRALLANYKNRTPLVLVIDDNYACFPFDLASKDVTYAALGVYMITYAWVEHDPSQSNKKGRVARYKFAFQWCEDQGEPWWQSGPFLTSHSTPVATSLNEDVEMTPHQNFTEIKPEPMEANLPSVHDGGRLVWLEGTSREKLEELSRSDPPEPPPLEYPEGKQSTHERPSTNSELHSQLPLDAHHLATSSSDSPMDIDPPSQILHFTTESSRPASDSTPSPMHNPAIQDNQAHSARVLENRLPSSLAQLMNPVQVYRPYHVKHPVVKLEELLPPPSLSDPTSSDAAGATQDDKQQLLTISFPRTSLYAAVVKEEPSNYPIFGSSAIQVTCQRCQLPSPHIYEPGWTCLQPQCERFWTTSSGDEFEPSAFHTDFLQLRDIGPIPEKHRQIRPAQPKVGQSDDPTAAAFTRGWHCQSCGRLSCRSRWEEWKCENCDATCEASMTVREAKEFKEHPCTLGRGKGDFAIHSASRISSPSEQTFKYAPAKQGNMKIFQLPDNIGRIIHICLDETDEEPDLIFKDYQTEANTGNLRFRRWPMRAHKCRGKLLTNYFSQNSGEPYHYVGGTENTVPFGSAPGAVVKAQQLIVDRVTAALGRPVEFNEILSAAYMQDQKMAFHSDAERGLGPTVAGFSMGSPAVIHFRRLRRRGSQEKHVIELSIVLRHGDILVMDGAEVQLQYQHTVVPTNFRIAATARFIDPSCHVKSEAKPDIKLFQHPPAPPGPMVED